MRYISLFGITSAFLCSLYLPSFTYANIDKEVLTEFTYNCREDSTTKTATGELTLNLRYGGKTIISKTYTVNNAGTVSSLINDDPNNWFWTIGKEKKDNYTILGCGCPSPLTSNKTYSSLTTKNESGSTVAKDYIFTIGSGGTREGVRLADEVELVPTTNGGIPRECSASGGTGTVDREPSVSFSVSGNTLYGTVRNLTGTNATSCLEILGKTSGTGAEGSCSTSSGVWKALQNSQSGWTYSGSTWYLETAVGSGTAFPANVYRWYMKNITTNKIGSGDFQVGDGNGTPVVAFTLSGLNLTGTVKNLESDNSYACIIIRGSGSCTNSTGSNTWVKMTQNQSGWIYTGSIWYLSTNVGSGTIYTDGKYEWHWRNGTGGAIGKGEFVVDSASALRPVVSFTLSGTSLTGTVTRLTAENSYSCLVIALSGSCSNNSGSNTWTKMVSNQGGWAYSGGIWYGSMKVGSGTQFGSGTHTWYWREGSNGPNGSGSFTVQDDSTGTGACPPDKQVCTNGTTLSRTGASCSFPTCPSTGSVAPVVSFMVSGNILTGKVLNLTATNAMACLEVLGRTSGQDAEGSCRSGNGSGWTNMPVNGWSYTTASGTWNLTQTVGPNTTIPDGQYMGFWKNTTNGLMGSGAFTVGSGSSGAPLVSFSVSGSTLIGTVRNLTATNATSCLEVLGRTSGQNAEGSCRSGNGAGWTNMPANGWSYTTASGTWNLSTTVGSGTAIPNGRYMGFWKNTTNGLMGSGTFLVSVTPGTTPVVNLQVITIGTGKWLTGSVANLPASNVFGCLEVVGRGTGTNAEGYCNADATHWTAFPNQSWKYNTTLSTWEPNSIQVGDNTDLPPNTYRVFFKNGATNSIGMGTFQVLTTKGVRIIGEVSGVGTEGYGKDAVTQGYIVDGTKMNTLRNALITNITKNTLNADDGVIANGIIKYHRNLRYSDIPADKKHFGTLVVYGDLTLDQNILNGIKGIVVLKDDAGKGGKVVVDDAVTSINVLVYADDILMGESTDSSVLNPNQQLVLKGALFSKNTIGGSADPENLFLYPHTPTTNLNMAFMQDLNTVRSGNGGAQYKGYNDAFIIEYDSTAITNPPAGF